LLEIAFIIEKEIGQHIMQFSARNQLKGTVKSVKLAGVMAEVVIELPDGQEVVSAITRGSVESMNIKEGDTVYAVIKSTEVMIGKDQ
jgi:molybdate transport system regulatory protein